MKIYIDSANLKEIEKWLNYGVIDGVTTNPSIMLKDGVYDVEAGIKKIARLIDPLPISVEVTTNDSKEMIEQARRLAALGHNIVVKIPVENEFGVPCYGLIGQLEKSGVTVNATAIMSFGQIILAAKAGASYVSLFAGRVADEGGNSPEVIVESVEWLEHWEYKSKLIVGSIRSVGDILNAATAGAHIITIPPQYLSKMADHKYTRETVKEFIADSKSALKIMGQGKT
jgi:transaldolase